MAANLSRLLICDIEAACWDSAHEQGDQKNEIIEIGACWLDLITGQVSDKTSICVKPRNAKISNFCTTLTGWTQEAVDGGVDIVDALKIFQEKLKPTHYHTWISCGEYDRKKLSSAPWEQGGLYCLYGIDRQDNPFEHLRSHINIKTLMAMKEGISREKGMEAMLRYYNIPLIGRHHNGADDAANIAQIAYRVLRK